MIVMTVIVESRIRVRWYNVMEMNLRKEGPALTAKECLIA